MSLERQLEEAANFIRGRDEFLIVSHVQPDGDAISSTAAVGWLLGKLGKQYAMYNDGPVPSRLSYLWNSEEIATAARPPQKKYRNIILVDCADFARSGAAKELFADEAELLNIDHHPTNDAFGLVNLLQFDAAATAEILFDLIQAFNLPLDADVATALYTGLMTDTGGFRYANTSSHVMNIASRLLDAGADGPALAEKLLERMTMGQMRMIQRALARLSFSEDGRIGWLWVSKDDLSETGASNEDLEGLVNYPRNVEGVEVGLLFKQTEPSSVKISLRSAGLVNVAAVAQQFGGGGHVRAAGCRVAVPLDEAVEQVVGAIRTALEDAG
ncbi:bifunctional oligoribonuclease/PAP phosphatase NrnA [Cohnella lubricantis]|uniref:Bifunctional oligoribonuclease/PAP phosphatase NrnA n=1 Tax=Cohnella lubricantis TaxID=2163172 RepID=A0A841T5F1_9BACL|nr:bifunctional oligoribonuclease/PAP phosphatase NrnA [Cohnella lubricantis]MBB6676544.1 bifunctional oligoribonuclease/PAP phosphatase NrnA [Cohnella lubricantis]MBP2117445.1 phosphoesterase RecJ-like protein [Cohnella lubricantis]